MDSLFFFGRVLRGAASLWPRMLKLVMVWELVLAFCLVVPFTLLYSFFIPLQSLAESAQAGAGAAGLAVVPAEYWVWLAGLLIAFLLVKLLYIGCTTVSGLKVANGDSWSFEETLRSSVSRYGTLLLTSLVQVLAYLCFALAYGGRHVNNIGIKLGLMCLIIPGIILAVLFYIAPILVFTSGENAWRCLRESKALSSRFWLGLTADILLVNLVLFLLFLGNKHLLRLIFTRIGAAAVSLYMAGTQPNLGKVKLIIFGIYSMLFVTVSASGATVLANKIAVHAELSALSDPRLPSDVETPVLGRRPGNEVEVEK